MPRRACTFESRECVGHAARWLVLAAVHGEPHALAPLTTDAPHRQPLPVRVAHISPVLGNVGGAMIAMPDNPIIANGRHRGPSVLSRGALDNSSDAHPHAWLLSYPPHTLIITDFLLDMWLLSIQKAVGSGWSIVDRKPSGVVQFGRNDTNCSPGRKSRVSGNQSFRIPSGTAQSGAAESLCRPSGTRFFFPLYPALKRWANLCRAYGANLWLVCSSLQLTIELRHSFLRDSVPARRHFRPYPYSLLPTPYSLLPTHYSLLTRRQPFHHVHPNLPPCP